MIKPTTPAASEARHTPGEIEWSGTGKLRSREYGRYIAHDNRSIGHDYGDAEESANQIRLAACWNACEKHFPQSDPAAGIAALKEALSNMAEQVADYGSQTLNAHKRDMGETPRNAAYHAALRADIEAARLALANQNPT